MATTIPNGLSAYTTLASTLNKLVCKSITDTEKYILAANLTKGLSYPFTKLTSRVCLNVVGFF